MLQYKVKPETHAKAIELGTQLAKVHDLLCDFWNDEYNSAVETQDDALFSFCAYIDEARVSTGDAIEYIETATKEFEVIE